MAPRLLLASLSAVEAQRLHVINACNTQPVWIAATSGSGLADTVKIDAGGQRDFDVDRLPNGQRYWPKFGCNGSGQECAVGDSGGPGQTCGAAGCAPPVDSKFEITVDKGNNVDWWDTSAVDGYTVPFKVELDGCGTQSPNIDCSHLSLDECPTENILNVGEKSLKLLHPESQQAVGCYSPCAKLTTGNWNNPDGTHTPADSIGEPYCCPTWTPERCRAGPSASMLYTKSIHANCPHTYAYSYDDDDGLHTCPTGTHYTWTVYCPTGGSGPSPSPPPTPTPTPTPSPAPSPSWQPCTGGVCCDPHGSPAQYCPNGEQCQQCGADACQCPGAATVV